MACISDRIEGQGCNGLKNMRKKNDIVSCPSETVWVERINKGRKKASINMASNLSEIFWPEFITKRDCVFIARKGASTDLSYPVQTESDSSHTHILDLFDHKAHSKRAPFFKTTHPDFKLGFELGRKICYMWALKLMHDFPQSDFRVYLHGLDPIVRFHKIRKCVPNWAEPKDLGTQIKADKALILDTRELRKLRRK